MIRILHLIKALGRGGAEVLLREGQVLADHQRFELSYGYLQDHPDQVAEDLRAQGARVDCFHLNGHARMILGFHRLARYLREQRIHLVHAHLPLAGVVARVAGRMARVPVVYTEHNLQERYHPLTRSLNLLSWSWQDQVIAISDDVAGSISVHAKGQVPVCIIWNGVNTADFHPEISPPSGARERLGIPLRSPVVGTVASFSATPQKRLDLWLQAARIILDMEPTAHLLLVGDGPLRPALESQADSLGMKQVAHFVGRQKDVRPYLAAMDVFLMSSAYEGCPIAPLEAMSMEVPVVATRVKGIRNIVESGRTGLLTRSDRSLAEDLADLTVNLLRQPDLQRRFGEAGRRAVIDKFSLVRMQRELENVYERVLSRS